MDTLTSLHVFCQIVVSGSFTRAADTLGISTAMASKHLRHLEQRLGVRLMQRNSRSLHLTAEGEAYYQRVSEALTLLDTAASEAGSNHPQGHLRLTAPIWCANPVFARWMGEYRERYPAVSLDIFTGTFPDGFLFQGFPLAPFPAGHRRASGRKYRSRGV